MAALLWICVVMSALTAARARNCAENMIGLVTRRQDPWCGSRIEPDMSLRDLVGRRAVASVIEDGKSRGSRRAQRELVREKAITDMNITVQHLTPEYHHYLFTRPIPGTDKYFEQSTKHLYQAQETAALLVQEYNIPKWAGGDALTLLKITPDPNICPPKPVCSTRNSLYRTYDGSCNNVNNPTWGMAGETFSRLLPPVYDDGIWTIRKSVVDGSPLPSERHLRTRLIKDRNVPDDINNEIVMSWGQVVAHDTLASIDSVCSGGFGCMCCTQNGQFLREEYFSRNCYAVPIPSDDYLYGPFNRRCMGFGRSNATFALNCRLSAAEHINAPTSFLDASLVYGTSADQARSLRQMRDGKLLVSRSGNRDMLPKSTDAWEDCDIPGNEACYIAGDPRVNQNPQLAVLQTVLLRCHNNIAGRLKQLNPSWNDEKIYQEVRRILIAIIQHITYKEMVPIYLGREASLIHDLLPLDFGYNRGYNPNLNPTIINSHTGAAYRAVHGIIQGQINLVDEARCPMRSILLGNYYTRPGVIEQPTDSMDAFLRGLTSQPAQSVDEFSTVQVTDNLFKRNQYWGQDLGTLDIARGRERGLPCYNDYRELCGLPRAYRFEDFVEIPAYLVNIMKTLYKHVDDVDLYVGAFLERELPGALFGPTFHCICLEQFYRTKFGDRMFYEFRDAGFTEAQLNSIRKMTMSRLICDNADGITKIQRDSFRKISDRNPVVSCSDIPILDLSPWKQR